MPSLRLVNGKYAFIGPKPHRAGMHSKQVCGTAEGKPIVSQYLLRCQRNFFGKVRFVRLLFEFVHIYTIQHNGGKEQH